MKGIELPVWRERNGYPNQAALMMELGIKSRTTLSTIENSAEDIPRSIFLALMALEYVPVLRRVVGETMSGASQKKYRDLSPTLSSLSSTYQDYRYEK